MFWRMIDSDRCEAAYNMALDEAIAGSVRRGEVPPTLRLYGWEGPSVSLGSLQKIDDIDVDYCIGNGIPIVRRPTGGRAILHGDELTYSFSSRNEGFFSGGLLDAYSRIGAVLRSALALLGVEADMKGTRESGKVLTGSVLCFRSHSYGEITYKGKKIIGSAQRRWTDGFLQQGSIPYSLDYGKIRGVFRIGREECGGTHDLSPDSCHGSLFRGMAGLREVLRPLDPVRVKDCLRLSFEEHFGVTLEESLPSLPEEEAALQLVREKYRNPRWTQGRRESNP